MRINQIYDISWLKRTFSGFLLLMVLLGLLPKFALAADIDSVVINEIAWAGTQDSSNDEWIEIYNTTDNMIDLSNWHLIDDGVVVFVFPEGSQIASKTYQLIEDKELVTDIPSDYIYNMSLANTGDTLQLADANGQIIDSVNLSGNTWYAGSSTTYATMERINPYLGDFKENFASAVSENGAKGSLGSGILGTPRSQNSVFDLGEGQSNFNQIKAVFENNNWHAGDIIELKVSVENVSKLFVYGIGLIYDSSILEFQGAFKGDFLSAGNENATSFQSGLRGGEEGNLLIAEARLDQMKNGVDGSGNLFTIQFKVLSEVSVNTAIIFASDSFAATPNNDIEITFENAVYEPELILSPVNNLTTQIGDDRYQIKLSWDKSSVNNVQYQIERLGADGNWYVIGVSDDNYFIDKDSVNNGGNIIPNLTYSYRVAVKKGEDLSAYQEIQGMDFRGVKGDNNRSDLVDGRDLEKLAIHFGESLENESFDPLVDTTYDGLINGSDLIDLGSNFAKKY